MADWLEPTSLFSAESELEVTLVLFSDFVSDLTLDRQYLSVLEQ